MNRGILYDADVVDACLRLFNEKGLDLSRFPCYQTVNLGKVSSLFMAHVRIFSAAVIRCRRCLSLSILPV